MEINEAYQRILTVTKWRDEDIKARGTTREASEHRAIIACILSDMRFIQEDIARMIGRDRTTIVHYKKNIRQYVSVDIESIKKRAMRQLI